MIGAVLPLLLIIAAELLGLNLTKLWKYHTDGSIVSLTFSDNGNLGVASWVGCYYVFDLEGKLLGKGCGSGSMDYVSFSNGLFGFVCGDDYAYIAYENGTLLKAIRLEPEYVYTLTMLPDGFIACGFRCAYFDFDGNKVWDVDVSWVHNAPRVYANYVYVADHDQDALLLLSLENGTILKKWDFEESPYGVDICNNYLALATASHLYLYKIQSPTKLVELWSVGGLRQGWQVSFSPDCKYVAVTDKGEVIDGSGGKLRIYSVSGTEVFEKSYGTEVYSVAWFNDRIAVGLGNDTVIVYGTGEEHQPPTSLNSILPLCIPLCRRHRTHLSVRSRSSH